MTGVDAWRVELEHAAEHAEHARDREHAREVLGELNAAKRAAAEEYARDLWSRLAARSVDGERYLGGRGLDASALIELGAVRFWRDGSPTVALHDLDTGVIVNVARRRISGDGPKVLGLAGCGTAGSLVGRVGEVDEGRDVVVITEGIVDTLAAVLIWPGCVIVGAHGASNLPTLAAAAAPRAIAVRGEMLIVPHVDGGIGEDKAADAVIAAERVGLELDQTIRLVDVRPGKDLAEAHANGWRWEWPA